MTAFLLLFWFSAVALADDSKLITSQFSAKDFPLSADPENAAWNGIKGIVVEKDRQGKPVPGHRTEVRSRWTTQNIYFLFICPYDELHLRPNPSAVKETNELWNWDVAEVFIGSDTKDITRYKEFEVSPQGEWVDLDVIRGQKLEADWLWNSEFESKARIDTSKKIWYAEMRIPIEKIDQRTPKAGLEYRINFYRCQGKPPSRKYITWQPTHNDSFHIPQVFGQLRLER